MGNVDALKLAVEAASQFKYWLDTQPAGAAFHPSGQDARNTDAYAQAAKDLAAAEDALKGNLIVHAHDVTCGTVATIGTVCSKMTELRAQFQQLVFALHTAGAKDSKLFAAVCQQRDQFDQLLLQSEPSILFKDQAP